MFAYTIYDTLGEERCQGIHILTDGCNRFGSEGKQKTFLSFFLLCFIIVFKFILQAALCGDVDIPGEMRAVFFYKKLNQCSITTYFYNAIGMHGAFFMYLFDL